MIAYSEILFTSTRSVISVLAFWGNDILLLMNILVGLASTTF